MEDKEQVAGSREQGVSGSGRIPSAGGLEKGGRRRAAQSQAASIRHEFRAEETMIVGCWFAPCGPPRQTVHTVPRAGEKGKGTRQGAWGTGHGAVGGVHTLP
jgi:hypothetical protein